MDKNAINALSNKIIGIAIEVHRELGPGFNEKIYQNALTEEFKTRGVRFKKEEPVEARYKGKVVGEQRIDLIVENELILEIKSTNSIGNIHIAQVISYLKVLNKKLGLILNFAEPKLEIKRVVNRL